jgi:hypothetical protein
MDKIKIYKSLLSDFLPPDTPKWNILYRCCYTPKWIDASSAPAAQTFSFERALHLANIHLGSHHNNCLSRERGLSYLGKPGHKCYTKQG